MIRLSCDVQKFCPLLPPGGITLVTWTKVLTGVAEPPALLAVTLYDVPVAGAWILTAQLVEEMPWFQLQDTTAPPLAHDADRVTVVPAATAAADVFGD